MTVQRLRAESILTPWPEGIAAVDQSVLDHAGLIAPVRQTQEEFEAHGALNQLNLLLRDFVREIMERRLLEKVEFVRLKESNRLDSSDKGETSGSGQLAS